jgi:hypothetical protein
MKKTNITLSIALAAVFSSSVAFAEAEVTGKIVHESAKFTNAGVGIGAAAKHTDTVNTHDKDSFKQATSARIFIDGDAEELYEGATYHVEVQAFRDSKGIGKHDGNESYTQRDALREAYVDAEVNDYSLRVGKQQVVWGTADGMKLLDAINPTDYTEMAQNQMEDSRIPVWMINAETDLSTGGNIQMVISQAKSSQFAGLGKASAKSVTNHSADNADKGHAFKMKGVDTITGRVNGFLNVAPALGAVAYQGFGGNGITDSAKGFLETNYTGEGVTVWDYVNDNADDKFGRNRVDGYAGGPYAAVTSWIGLCNSAASNAGITNVCDAAQTGAAEDNPTATFEYMSAASFATFDTLGQISSEYRLNHPTGADSNVSLRYKNSTTDGINYSVNYMNGYDTNPSVDMHWESDTGNRLYAGTTTADSVGVSYVSDGVSGATLGSGADVTTVRLYSTAAKAADAENSTAYNVIDDGGYANLVMVESLNKIQQLGGSFDMAVETATLGPIVIRGEGLYQKDVESPVINRKALGHGDLVGGLSMVKGDVFKYVLGADITVMTNMMVSAQIIQERNLDFIDETQTGSSEYGANLGRYTGDRAVLSMTNGLKKATENKEFYSLFLSKPFGASGEHRWNNIFMFEENGGKWNRLDAEFSIDDDTQATVEYNKYWGDANTQFGQLEKSSNIQVGVKYSF